MSGIVCAVRGGPHSQPTIERAIALAAEMDLPLVFLYVVNLEFLEMTATSRTHTISKEMMQMGEFILMMAQSRAEANHIEVQTQIRHGRVAEEISDLCHEIDADYLVIGRPRLQVVESVFAEDRLSKFIERVEAQTGAKVVLPDED